MANVGIPSKTVTRSIENGVMVSGRVHTVPSNLANNDTMDIATIPEGHRILGIFAKTSAATASQTIDIGDGTTVDRFLDGSTAFQTADLVAQANEDLGEVLTADTTVRITFLGDAPDATDVITAWVVHTRDDFPADSEAAV